MPVAKRPQVETPRGRLSARGGRQRPEQPKGEHGRDYLPHGQSLRQGQHDAKPGASSLLALGFDGSFHRGEHDAAHLAAQRPYLVRERGAR